jgi:ribosomal protein L37AE/L43A
MQDKRFLESKVAEMTSTLELVQNQRNELKQSYKVGILQCHGCGTSADGGATLCRYATLQNRAPVSTVLVPV